MKHLEKIVLGAASVAAFLVYQSAQAQQTLPFYEPFPTSYTAGSQIGSAPSSTIWSQGGGLGGGSPIFTNSPLSYSGLVTDGSSLSVFMHSTSSGNRTRGLNFTTTSSGTLYASFLLDVVAAPTANRMFASLTADSSASANGSVMGIFVNSSSQLQIGKNSSSAPAAGTTAALTLGTVNLVVARYTWNAAAGDDEFALWLNPSSLGGSAPTADISTTTGTDFADLDWFYLIQRNNASIASSVLLLDELRIGTSWADVTPVPEPSVFALTGLGAFGLLAWFRRLRR